MHGFALVRGYQYHRSDFWGLFQKGFLPSELSTNDYAKILFTHFFLRDLRNTVWSFERV